MPDPNLTPFRGNSGNNTLASDRDGRDLYGLDGDDRLSSDFDRTYLYGGSGVDRLRTVLVQRTPGPSVELSARQYGDDGADVLVMRLRAAEGSDARLSQYGGTGDDRIESSLQSGGVINLYVNAGLGDDDIRATSLPESISMSARHVISTHAGDDVIVSLMREAENGDTRIYGGAGDDVIDARTESSYSGDNTETSNRIYGGDGDDMITAYASAVGNGSREAMNLIFGGNGADVITAAILTYTNVDSPLGASTIYGGEGADVITLDHVGGAGNFASVLRAKIYGGDGGDYVEARAVAESEYVRETVTNELWGEAGGDVLIAEAVAGPEFNDADTFSVRRATNVLDGGTGNDRLVATALAHPDEGVDSLAINRLFGRAGNDTLQATISENGPGRNLLYGGDGADTLRSSGGQDNVLSGGGGRDRIYASNIDQIYPASSDETLSGGSHIDTFYFRLGAGGTKTITDFERDTDRLSFGGTSTEFLESVSEVVDEGAGGDVVVDLTFNSATTTLVFQGLGTGGIDSILDLVANPEDQFLV